MSASDGKPPRVARGEADRAHMERWLNGEVNKLLDAEDKEMRRMAVAWATRVSDDADFRQQHDQRMSEDRARLKSDDAVIEAARRGDLEPARQKYPKLAEADMFKLPKQPGKGKRFPKARGLSGLNDFETALTEAVWDTAKMRAILKHNYQPRQRGYDSPEAMAARRNGVNEEHVRAWAKNRRCPKIPTAAAVHLPCDQTTPHDGT